MPMLSCTCSNANCPAGPHKGKAVCMSATRRAVSTRHHQTRFSRTPLKAGPSQIRIRVESRSRSAKPAWTQIDNATVQDARALDGLRTSKVTYLAMSASGTFLRLVRTSKTSRDPLSSSNLSRPTVAQPRTGSFRAAWPLYEALPGIQSAVDVEGAIFDPNGFPNYGLWRTIPVPRFEQPVLRFAVGGGHLNGESHFVAGSR